MSAAGVGRPRPSRLSGRPRGPVAVPAAVAALCGGREPEPLWRNELGGLTFRCGDLVVKWAGPGTAEVDLGDEALRLAWAAGRTPVPEVVGTGADADGSWLVTRAMPGRNAVEPFWRERPRQAAQGVGRGLRALHDALPVETCPWSWSVEDRAGEAGAGLGDVPTVDRLVVCHGDACAPNTLLADDGSVVGHVDLGRLGVADRWADLAVAAWSTVWNFGPGHEDAVYAAYGVDPDPVRIRFYRTLWALD